VSDVTTTRVGAPTVRLTDGILAAIAADLTSVPPERGGALLGYGELGHLFVSDTSGTYNAVSWDISREMSQAIAILEQGGYGTLCGTVHSHPSGVADPSGTDIQTMSHALDMNPHLEQMVIAVVTAGVPRDLDVALAPGHRMSVHTLRRTKDGGTSLERARVEAVQLHADLADAGLDVNAATSVEAVLADRTSDLSPVLTVAGHDSLVVPLRTSEPRALVIDGLYPRVGPLGVRPDRSRDGAVVMTPLPSPWDRTMAHGPQLADRARRYAGDAEHGTWDRVTELVGSLRRKTVAVVGCGSVGSRIAEDLTRCGVGHLVLVDPDEVEPPNLSRTVYTTVDLGQRKVDALGRRLLSINPGLSLDTHALSISELDLGEALDNVDLVVAATDDMQEQAGLAHIVYDKAIPLLACAMYRKAAAGEVVIVVPTAGTACWSCAVGAGSDLSAQRPATNYGLGRLVGESALGPSINIVTSVASQTAVGMLAGPDSVAGAPLTTLLAQNRTLGLVSTTPGWEFFPQLFDGLGHQFQPQSVWPRVQPNPDCPVCGLDRERPLSQDEGERLVADLSALVAEEAAAPSTPASPGDIGDADTPRRRGLASVGRGHLVRRLLRLGRARD